MHYATKNICSTNYLASVLQLAVLCTDSLGNVVIRGSISCTLPCRGIAVDEMLGPVAAHQSIGRKRHSGMSENVERFILHNIQIDKK